MSAARVFINYRRADSAGWARGLHDDLVARFGAERVFRDVVMEPGVPFREHIERVMSACEVCLVVIGPRWTTVTDSAGNRRLDDPRDLVRLEIERALQRSDVHVIPVLVDGARMPAASELPEGLKRLREFNAAELTDSRWEYDHGRLCERLMCVLGESTIRRAVRPQPEDERTTAPRQLTAAAWAMAGAAAVGALVAAPATATLKDQRDAVHIVRDQPIAEKAGEVAERLAYFAAERAVLWAIVVALAVVAGGLVLGRHGVFGPLVLGIGGGAFAGAVGAAVFVALKDLPKEAPADGLVHAIAFAITGAMIGGVLARVASEVLRGDCRLAGLAGGAMAGLLTGLFENAAGGERVIAFVLISVVIVGSVSAVIAAPAARRHAAAVSATGARRRAAAA